MRRWLIVAAAGLAGCSSPVVFQGKTTLVVTGPPAAQPPRAEVRDHKISRPTVEPAHSTAPPALGRCVVKAIDGLVLAPPDGKEARATFVYAFQPAPAT